MEFVVFAASRKSRKVLPPLIVSRFVPGPLIVMGTVARTGITGIFIGNTAERVLSRLPCDVLVVKPGDFGEKLPF